MCVLLIDDDDIFRVIFKKIFISNDICDDVNSVNNGQEAFNKLKLKDNKGEYWPEAIFVDINMPIMNGWEFLDLYKYFSLTMEERKSYCQGGNEISKR